MTIGGPPNPIRTPGSDANDPVERRTQLELKQDTIHELTGRLEAVMRRNEHAMRLANEIRAIHAVGPRNEKIDQLIEVLAAPI